MGMTRKLLSLGTLGLIDYRSDKELIARNTRRTHSAVLQQTRAIRQEARRDRRAQYASGGRGVWVAVRAPKLPPAGWYPDPDRVSGLRWWDGRKWTDWRHG